MKPQWISAAIINLLPYSIQEGECFFAKNSHVWSPVSAGLIALLLIELLLLLNVHERVMHFINSMWKAIAFKYVTCALMRVLKWKEKKKTQPIYIKISFNSRLIAHMHYYCTAFSLLPCTHGRSSVTIRWAVASFGDVDLFEKMSTFLKRCRHIVLLSPRSVLHNEHPTLLSTTYRNGTPPQFECDIILSIRMCVQCILHCTMYT